MNPSDYVTDQVAERFMDYNGMVYQNPAQRPFFWPLDRGLKEFGCSFSLDYFNPGFDSAIDYVRWLGREINGYVYAAIRVLKRDPELRRIVSPFDYYMLYVPNRFEDLTVIPESGYAMAYLQRTGQTMIIGFGRDERGYITIIPDAMDDYIAWKKHREKIFGINI